MSAAIGLLFFDTVTPLFKHARVVELTGVSSSNLQNWITRGVYSPSFAELPKRAARLYTALDLGVIAIANKLLEFGAAPYHAFCTSEILIEDFLAVITHFEKENIKNGGSPVDVTQIFTMSKIAAGDENYLSLSEDPNNFLTFKGEHFHQLHRGQQPGFIIPTGAILNDLALRTARSGRTRSEIIKYTEAEIKRMQEEALSRHLYDIAQAPLTKVRLSSSVFGDEPSGELSQAREAYITALRRHQDGEKFDPDGELFRLNRELTQAQVKAAGINDSDFVEKQPVKKRQLSKAKITKSKPGGADAKR